MARLDTILKQLQRKEKEARKEEHKEKLINKQIKKEFKKIIPELKTLFKISKMIQLNISLDDGSRWPIKDGALSFSSKNHSGTIKKVAIAGLSEYETICFYYDVDTTCSWLIGTSMFYQWVFMPEDTLSDSDTRETMRYFLNVFPEVIQKIEETVLENQVQKS